MKKINIRSYILGLVTALVFLAFPTSVFASPVSEMINVFYNNIKIVVDGKAAEFGKDSDGNDIQPFIYKGTTYLPVRAVGETLGKEVSWDGTTQTVYLGDKPEAKQTSKGDIEPNNTYQDASLVYTGDTITGTITDGDDDFYKIDILKEGELTLDLLSLEG